MKNKRKHPIKFAKYLRCNMTSTETLLWKRVKHLGFYAQQPLLDYIVDFYHPSTGLIIEVDGGYHQSPQVKKQDAYRDSILAQYGHTVLRFTSEQVLTDIETIVDKVRKVIQCY